MDNIRRLRATRAGHRGVLTKAMAAIHLFVRHEPTQDLAPVATMHQAKVAKKLAVLSNLDEQVQAEIET